MKLYKVFFDEECKNLDNGYLIYPRYKKESYEKRKDFNTKMFGAFYENTFKQEEIEDSMFFFLDLKDAIRYTQYSNSKFGNYKTQKTKYKILELDIPQELVGKYLGVGIYAFEREYSNQISLEAAIPFDKLSSSFQCTLVKEDVIKLSNAKIYDKNSIEVINVLNNGEYVKNDKYISVIEEILSLLGFELNLGMLYKKDIGGKQVMLMNFREFFISEMFPTINKVIEENQILDVINKKNR